MYACGVLWVSTCRVDASKMVDAVKRSRDAKLPNVDRDLTQAPDPEPRASKDSMPPSRASPARLELVLPTSMPPLPVPYTTPQSFRAAENAFSAHDTAYATLKLSNDVPKHSYEDFLREKWCSQMTPSCDSRNNQSLCPARTTACSVAQERSHRRHVGNRQRPGGMS